MAIGIPVLVVLLSFALSNRAPTRVVFWPSEVTLECPLSIIVLAAAGTAFLMGALFVWATEWPNRRAKKRAETVRALLEEELRAIRARDPASAPPPAPGGSS